MESVELVSGKALWGVICGTYILPSDEVVGEELQIATQHLRLGLNAYEKPSGKHYEEWAKSADVKPSEKEFAKKIYPLLDLTASQSWEIFKLFLLTDFRGAEASLSEILGSQRGEEAFLSQLWTFYLADRLHLLRCLRHIVANTANPNHPYQSLFRDFMHDVVDKDGTLGDSLVKQVMTCSRMTPPNVQSHGPHLPPHGPHTWLTHHLAELRELLATLLVYYGSTTHLPSPDTFQKLLLLAQGGGLGGRVEVQDGMRDSHRPLVEALDATHVLLLTLIINADSSTSGHCLCESGWVKRLDPIMACFGARTPHHAPLLAWAVLQLRASGDGSRSSAIYHKLAQRALHGNVFSYLQISLNNETILGDELLLRLASSVVYSLVCAAAGCLDLERVGCLPVLNKLAETCLAQDPPAALFWAEEDGATGLLLPQALEVFPYDVGPLLALSTALALANVESCLKVVELLSELPNLTWIVSEADFENLIIQGSVCITKAPLEPLQSLIVPARTEGKLLSTNPPVVAWQMPTNAWQALLVIMRQLDYQVSVGVVVPEPKILSAVCGTMRLLTAIHTTVPDQLPAFVHFVDQSIVLLRRLSQVMRPPSMLVAALLEFLANVAMEEPERVWSELEGCTLLPFFVAPQAVTGAKRGKGDPFLGYRAGGLRALVCGEEAAAGTYPILRSYTKLLTQAVKGGVSGGSIGGGVVFMSREVTGPSMRWCYSDPKERDSVLDECLTLLHHTLEASKLNSNLRDLVVHQLVDRSSAGQTLLSVVVNGASFESALNQPTHSPVSTHARRLTRTAQMALSILHRLVGEDSSIGGLSQLLCAAPTPGITLGGGRLMKGGTGSPPHLALTIALYVHQRLNPRLSYLALLTLTRFAQKLDVPLVACLGSEADGIRDALLRRLDSDTEDVGVKVALLRLLKASTTKQQGLTNAFLTPPEKLLDPLTTLLTNPSSNETGQKLTLAIVELVDALWTEKYTTATVYLQDKEAFWNALAYPLINDRPGEMSDAVAGHTLRILAHQVFASDAKPHASLKEVMDKLCDPAEGIICQWSKHIISNLESETSSSNSIQELLLPAWRDFLVVLVARAKSWLTAQQKVTLASDILNGLVYQLDGRAVDEVATNLLAQLYLALVKHCGKQLSETNDCFESLSKLLLLMQEAVMETPTHCHLMILGAALRMVTLTDASYESQDDVVVLLDPVLELVQQHGRLAGSANTSVTSASTLNIATALLHQCLLRCHPDTAELHLKYSPVVPALLHATEIYMKSGQEDVVGELLRLLATLSRISHQSDDLSTSTLSSTLTLTIPPSKTSLLSEVVWGVVWGVIREGVAGVEGGVNIAAVHLSALCGSLIAPHRQPGLALATAALVTSLAPHASLWIVTHAASYTQLTSAITRCIHLTTHLLCTPRIVQIELSGQGSSSGGTTTGTIAATATSDPSGSTAQISPATTAVLNHMLQLLCACLGAVSALGPDLTDLLCEPGIDVGAWTLFFHPSFRPVSAHDPSAQPSLASLTSVLDLFDSHASKESRGVSPCRSGAPEVGLDVRVLATCAEQALLLLLTQSTLALMSPDTSPRDALRVRHGLADEMSSFFNRWLGRRPAVSPLPTSSGISSSAHIDLTYLHLAKHLVGRLSSTK